MALSYPEIDPVAFSLGPIQVHWYGLMYLAGFACAWWLAVKRSQKPWSAVRRQKVEDLVVYVAFGVILGGRVGYVMFYNLDKWLADPLWLFRVWEGGMAFHGGLVGVMVAMALFARHTRRRFLAVSDFVAPLVPIGLGLGRVGNFIGQELWGRQTDVAWGMVFPRDPDQLVRHPSQLYQAMLEGVILFAILFWFSRKPRATGVTSGFFLVLYGVFRVLVEFVRQPDAHIGYDWQGWLTRGQLLSIPMIAAGICLVVYGIICHKINKPEGSAS